MHDQYIAEAHRVFIPRRGILILHYHVLTDKREWDEGGLWDSFRETGGKCSVAAEIQKCMPRRVKIWKRIPNDYVAWIVNKEISKAPITMTKKERLAMIKNSVSYRMVHVIAMWMDQRLLDPLIGLILPGVGDALTSMLALPFIYLSMVQMRSLPLTLAIIYNILLDILIGIIPYVGIVGDFFKRAFAKNAILIKGYVEGDKDIIKEVERKAVLMAFLIIILGTLIYAMCLFTVRIVEWIVSLF